jgi:hypothetical protein
VIKQLRDEVGLDEAERIGDAFCMSSPLTGLDPERRRRRLRLLAEYADATALRQKLQPQRARIERIRDLVDLRRRLAG